MENGIRILLGRPTMTIHDRTDTVQLRDLGRSKPGEPSPNADVLGDEGSCQVNFNLRDGQVDSRDLFDRGRDYELILRPVPDGETE